MSELLHNQIRLYPFDADENDEAELQLNERIRVSCLEQRSHTQLTQQEMLPFAVVGSEKTVVVDGKPVRGRKNRWGVINVEDERHCEFVYLRNFLTR
jgi:septin 3/9/12